MLADGVHAVHVAMGENFTFGFKAAGTMATLPAMAAAHGMTAETVPLLRLGERDRELHLDPRGPRGR